MSSDTQTAPQTQPFQAEVAELLRLMVHAVYSEGDILSNSQAIHEFSNCSGGFIDGRYTARESQFNRL